MKMKTLLLAAGIVLALGTGVGASAQEKDTSSLGKDIKKGAKKVGNKTAELASKGSSTVIDKTYKGKKGPHGEKVYIDNQSRYYYVDKKGKRNYIKVLDLKTQP